MRKSRLFQRLVDWLAGCRSRKDHAAEQDYEEAVYALEALKTLFEREVRNRARLGERESNAARDHK